MKLNSTPNLLFSTRFEVIFTTHDSFCQFRTLKKLGPRKTLLVDRNQKLTIDLVFARIISF